LNPQGRLEERAPAHSGARLAVQMEAYLAQLAEGLEELFPELSGQGAPAQAR
jgi:hypothetical protein